MTSHLNRRWAVAALSTVGLALLPACARRVPSGSSPTPAESDSTAAVSDVQIVVENHNSDDVVVTVRSAGGQVRRLGTVVGNGRGAFTFSERFAAASRRLVLIAHPMGARNSYQSEPFTVQPGQGVSWALANGFTGSSVSVY